MKHRIFLAISPDERMIRSIDENLSRNRHALELREGVRFSAKNNWHFTLSFLGYQDDSAVGVIAECLKETAVRLTPFELTLEYITYSTPPRMVWAVATEASSHKFRETKRIIEDELTEQGVPWRRDTRQSRAHITLARMRGTRLRESLPHRIPCRAGFIAHEIRLFESELLPQAPRYTELCTFPLGR